MVRAVSSSLFHLEVSNLGLLRSSTTGFETLVVKRRSSSTPKHGRGIDCGDDFLSVNAENMKPNSCQVGKKKKLFDLFERAFKLMKILSVEIWMMERSKLNPQNLVFNQTQVMKAHIHRAKFDDNSTKTPKVEIQFLKSSMATGVAA
ncbi:hypothetical protein IFM89_006362 [Coptis chinensis]|uniref:Uncharacterized protein n=1 Tax=Coptis chinensis TaxID=261450 RepID=A0A835HNZ1_9MAGN|nr:hypothetical protein IFM89_006362 [Coptis chinensis]